MRWVNGFSTQAGVPEVINVVAGTTYGVGAFVMAGHSWRQSALDAVLGPTEGQALGDAVEESCVVHRCVGQFHFDPTPGEGNIPFPLLMRGGVYVAQSDGDRNVLPISLLTPLVQNAEIDIEAPWMWTTQRVMVAPSPWRLGLWDNATPTYLSPFDVSSYAVQFDIDVNRRVGPQDVLVVQFELGAFFSGAVISSDLTVYLHGYCRVLLSD